MFHEVATFWDFAEALKEIRKTRLLAVLLSRQAVRDSTDSESCIIVRKIKVNLIVVRLNDWFDKFEYICKCVLMKVIWRISCEFSE